MLRIQSELKIIICGRNEIKRLKIKFIPKKIKNEREGMKQRAQK